jgi:hypothetical protein
MTRRTKYLLTVLMRALIMIARAIDTVLDHEPVDSVEEKRES